MVISVLLCLLAWALFFGPLLLLWCLPRQAEGIALDEFYDSRNPGRSGDAPHKLGPMS